LFSGGKDSFLSACKLLEKDNKVYFVTYENGCSLSSDNAVQGVNRLSDKYGQDNVRFIGIYNTSGIWRSFFLPFLNLKPSEVSEKYGEITYSQFNCLTCRLSMYLYSIVICRRLGINKVSDGARYSQGFAIELAPMIDRFKRLFMEYQIELILPVIDLDSDWQKKNELLLRGFVPKVSEPQCLCGVPLDNKLANEIIQGVVSFYDKEVLSRCKNLIDTIELSLEFNTESNMWL